MNKTLCRVVFKGEIAAGQNRAQVMQRVKTLCKYDDVTLTKIFSGKPCIIKDRLESHQAQKYKSALEQTGIVCYVQKLQISASQQKQVVAPAPPRPPVRSMTCPKCNWKQPESITCVQCGINVERYQQRQLAEQEQNAGSSDNFYFHTDSDNSYEMDMKQLLFSPGGRINRQRYILASLALGVVTIPANLVLVNLNILIYLIVILGVSYVSLMLAIKRAHDRDLSGHFCWLLLVPVISLWPTVVLTFFKGTDGHNRFGPDPLG